MKKLRFIAAMAAILSIFGLSCAPSAPSVFPPHVPELLESGEISADEIVDVVVSLDADSVMDGYLKKERDISPREYFASPAGEANRQKADDALQKATDALLSLGRTEIISTNALATTAIFARMPYGLIEKAKALSGIAEVERAPVFTLSDAVCDDSDEGEEGEGEQGESGEGEGEDTKSIEDFQSVLSANKIYDLYGEAIGGEGTLVAVLDTGLLTTHEAFSVMPATETAKIKSSAYLTNEVRSLLKGGSRANYYLNQKVVFRYDYADKDNDISPGRNYYTSPEHGTHVAGIIAGNNGGSFRGAAPNAQLAILKVFSNYNDGAALTTLVDALEDCLILDVDVVNMSLGTDSGVPENSVYNDVVRRLVAAGINVVAAGGNAGKSTSYDNPTQGLAKTDSPDYSIASAPASIRGVMMVASSGRNNNEFSVSTFSSWGPGSDLTIKPEITTPGYRVNSAVTSGTTRYENLDGTSMASPNYAGLAAVIRKKLRDELSLSGYELAEAVNNLLMSTAFIMRDGEIPLSPRSQGAGLADPAAALASPAYLSAHDGMRAKLDLGDDDEKTGEYTLAFEIHNMSDRTLEYTISHETIMEKPSVRVGNEICTATPRSLSPDFAILGMTGDCESSGEFGISVSPYGTALVVARITLSEVDRNYIEYYFPNGIYVEGFVRLLSEESRLNMPFLAFYGDWGAPAVLDPFDGSQSSSVYSKLSVNVAISATSNTKWGSYTYSGATEFDPEHAAIGKAVINKISSVSNVYPLRNFKALYLSITDFFTGKELFRSEQLYGASSRVLKSQNGALSNIIGTVNIGLSLEDMGGDAVFRNNGKYMFNLLPIGFDGEEARPSSTPFYVDYEPPAIESAQKSDDLLTITVSDNHYPQAAQFYYKRSGSEIALKTTYTKISADKIFSSGEVRLDLRDYTSQLAASDDGKIYMTVADYARNTSRYVLDVSGEDVVISSDKTEAQKSDDEPEAIDYEDCFYDTYGVLYKASPLGLELLSYPETLSVTSYKVLEGTVRIAEYAFTNGVLDSVVLPESVKKIGDNAFWNCPSLKRVILLGETPILETASDIVYENFAHKITLYAKGEINRAWDAFMCEDEITLQEVTAQTQLFSQDLSSFEYSRFFVLRAVCETYFPDFSLPEETEFYAQMREDYRNRMKELDLLSLLT